jgi:hypothetical protein
LLYALFLGVLTVSLAAGGHGWNSSLVSGLAGLVLLPAFGIAVALSGLRAGRILLWVVVALMLAVDAQVIWMTRSEWFYFEKVRQRGAEAIILWAILWFGWQVAVLAVLLLGRLNKATSVPTGLPRGGGALRT